MQDIATPTFGPKPRLCSNCGETFNIAELSDYLLYLDRKRIKCFNCKTYNHLTAPSLLNRVGSVILFSPLFLISTLPSFIAIILLIDYLDGNWNGRQVGIVFLFPACLAVTYILSRYIMRLIRFFFYPLEPIRT